MSTRSPQDLVTRTCQRSCKDTWRISPGPLQELLTKSCTRSCKKPLTAFHEDLHKNFSQGLVKDLGQDLHARTPKRSSQERRKMRESYKILRQEPPKSRAQELSYKHLYDMASPRASCEGLLVRISPGSPQDLLFRTCTRSCKDL